MRLFDMFTTLAPRGRSHTFDGRQQQYTLSRQGEGRFSVVPLMNVWEKSSTQIHITAWDQTLQRLREEFEEPWVQIQVGDDITAVVNEFNELKLIHDGTTWDYGRIYHRDGGFEALRTMDMSEDVLATVTDDPLYSDRILIAFCASIALMAHKDAIMHMLSGSVVDL